MDGNIVTIPITIEHTGTSWPGFTDVLLSIGAYPKIVTISSAENNYPWALKIFPDLKDETKQSFATDGANIEQLIANKPDVLFLRSSDPVDKVKATGIPVIMINNTNSLKTMASSLKLAGEVLGKDELAQATSYTDYLNKTIDDITSKTGGISSDSKPKVLYVSIKSGKISVWGKNLLQDEMITKAGGVNIAAGDVTGSKEISPEMLLKWNPDIIIADNPQTSKALFENADYENSLSALKNNRVYVAPAGVFYWTNMGAECVLQLPWLAQKVHPELFTDIDMENITKNFYSTFFKYNLSDDDTQKILAGQPPE
ncbi:ABC transporter substrate-binding protein [Methanospirillum lacunae]|nr:ABC transporter substrate-binding protein [Methanospirillum lacunae]